MTSAAFDPVEITRALIRCPSVTPADAGALDALQGPLETLGFTCHRLPFGEGETGPEARVDNLYARLGTAAPNFCFAGHTDVVPVDGQDWSSDPFRVVERDGRLYGRGTSDMKSFIAVVLATVPRLAKMELATPVHLAFSYDEEIGCLGVRPLLAELADRLDAVAANPDRTGTCGRPGPIDEHGVVEQQRLTPEPQLLAGAAGRDRRGRPRTPAAGRPW